MTDRSTHPVSDPTSREIVLAWLLDRREQYEPSSGTFSAFDELIHEFSEGDDIERYSRAELDDLIPKARQILGFRHRVLANTTCDRPPPGWRCSRERGHDGPCAAWADNRKGA